MIDHKYNPTNINNRSTMTSLLLIAGSLLTTALIAFIASSWELAAVMFIAFTLIGVLGYLLLHKKYKGPATP